MSDQHFAWFADTPHPQSEQLLVQGRKVCFPPIADMGSRWDVTLMADARNPFSRINAEELDREAQRHGFKREGRQNWIRRTCDFVQLVNLQHSQWSAEDRYLNFAMWPLAMGEPPTIAERKFQFRTRAERLGVNDLPSFFSAVDGLQTLAELRDAEKNSRHVIGLMRKELRTLLL